MQSLVRIYEQHQEIIQKFIVSSLRRLQLKEINNTTFDTLKESFPSLELLYECDQNMVQISANYGEGIYDVDQIGKRRDYLVDMEAIHGGYYVTEPYISSVSGDLCITVVHKCQGNFFFLDFRLRKLLERFHLIVSNTKFRRLSRLSYGLIGGGLLLFGLFVVLYGITSFAMYLFSDAEMSLEVVFKPVIALTLGLAVFDLGKTIFEQEVLPRTQNISEVFNPKSLITFMVSIIIALLIEALLVVFKISINDYKDLPYAAALIVAVSFLLYVFSRFVALQKGGSFKTGE